MGEKNMAKGGLNEKQSPLPPLAGAYETKSDSDVCVSPLSRLPFLGSVASHTALLTHRESCGG